MLTVAVAVETVAVVVAAVEVMEVVAKEAARAAAVAAVAAAAVDYLDLVVTGSMTEEEIAAEDVAVLVAARGGTCERRAAKGCPGNLCFEDSTRLPSCMVSMAWQDMVAAALPAEVPQVAAAAGATAHVP
jgi:hypothetical protein